MCESHQQVTLGTIPESVKSAIRALSPDLSPYQMDMEVLGLLVLKSVSSKHRYHEDLIELALSYVDDLDGHSDEEAEKLKVHTVTVLRFIFSDDPVALRACADLMRLHPRFPNLLA